jgi:hypothetical protein
MSASTLIIALDLMNAALTTATRYSAIIAKANAENRDITQDELKAAAAETDALIDRVEAEL